MRSAILISMAALALGGASMSITTAPAPKSVNTASATFFHAGEAKNLSDPDTYIYLQVLDANRCDTTYQMEMHDDKSFTKWQRTYTIVQRSNAYAWAYDHSADDVSATAAKTCSWFGTTRAVCSETVSMSVAGVTWIKTSSSATFTTWSSISYPIASGGKKLAYATGACNTHVNAAAPTGVFADVYKVIVVPAAAVAGAVAFI